MKFFTITDNKKSAQKEYFAEKGNEFYFTSDLSRAIKVLSSEVAVKEFQRAVKANNQESGKAFRNLEIEQHDTSAPVIPIYKGINPGAAYPAVKR